VKRIVVSDIHLGSRYCREEAFLSFLKNAEYDELILAGDIIDFIKVPMFSKRIIDIVGSIDFSKDIYYIVGNHDISLKQFVGQKCFGINFVNELIINDCGKLIKIEHGDKYDKPIIRNNSVMSIVSVIHNILESSFGWNVTSWWTEREFKKRKNGSLWNIISSNHEYDFIILGHFHIPEKIIWENNLGKRITYVNSGDWVTHQTYLEIFDGDVFLKNYEQS